MARGGLDKWFKKEKWVDISRTNADGSHPPCGRKKASTKGYPKCVPKAKAKRMTKAQKTSAVKRKRKAGLPSGGKPRNVSTFKKRKK